MLESDLMEEVRVRLAARHAPTPTLGDVADQARRDGNYVHAETVMAATTELGCYVQRHCRRHATWRTRLVSAPVCLFVRIR
jgi:hypothetical protein